MKKMILLVMLVVASMTMATAAYAIGPAYIPWSAAGGNAGTNGPHQNYQLNTEKCAVCHSVHAAATSNAAAGMFAPIVDGAIGAAETQLLLRSSVADACTYCHITTNVAGLQIYGGVASNYSTGDVYGHNGSTSAECADCHAVHGAGTFKGYISGKILKANGNGVANTSNNVQVEANTTLGGLVTAGGDVFAATAVSAGDVGDVQVSAFCTRCHKTFSDKSETTITASGYFSNYAGAVSFGPQSYKNHPMKAAEASFVASGSNFGGQVAWADSGTCRSCHAAGDTRVSTSYGGSGGLVAWSFPHYTPGNASFLPAGTSLADGNIGILDDHNAATGKPALSNVVADGVVDGACLRCHKQTALVGVGQTY